MKLDNESLAHTRWNCRYHIVFAPKYRRQVIYGKIKQDIGQMLRKLCEYKQVEILEAEAYKNHIHMLVSIPPKYSIAQIMGYLKGKSSLMIFEKYANMKYKYGNRHFWCRGYYVDTNELCINHGESRVYHQFRRNCISSKRSFVYHHCEKKCSLRLMIYTFGDEMHACA